MATVGQQLLQPEAGWKRIDNADKNFRYDGEWDIYSSNNYYNGTAIQSKNIGDKLYFKLRGSKIRIVCYTGVNRSDLIKIKINKDEYSFSTNSSTGAFQVLVFEKVMEKEDIYNIEIVNNNQQSNNIYFLVDAIDIGENDEIFRVNDDKLSIKNPTTNQHYSLAEKTLIPLPNDSVDNIVKHGIETGKEIQLDEVFDKIHYVVENPTIDTTDNSKVFTQILETRPNKLWIKEVK